MELSLYSVVHPIGPGDYPGQPDGWRWAIHTDINFHQWTQGCLNAGWAPDQASADAALSIVLITVRRALTAVGCTSTVRATVLADCPFTADIAAELAVLL